MGWTIGELRGKTLVIVDGPGKIQLWSHVYLSLKSAVSFAKYEE